MCAVQRRAVTCRRGSNVLGQKVGLLCGLGVFACVWLAPAAPLLTKPLVVMGRSPYALLLHNQISLFTATAPAGPTHSISV